MKKELDFNFSFVDFEGNEMPAYDINGNQLPGGAPAWRELGATLSLASAKDGNTAVKYFGLATELAKNKKLILDQADYQMLKDFVSGAQTRSDLKSQLLNVFNNAKEVE